MRNRQPGMERDDAAYSALEDQLAVAKKMLIDANLRNQRLVSLLNKQYGVGKVVLEDRGGDGDSLLADLEDGGMSLSSAGGGATYAEPGFLSGLWDRGSWLASLLLFQSFSSFILSHHEVILKAHPSIVYYLTALVGAGGNAGNQAAVRVIRALALGLVTEKNKFSIIGKEFFVSLALSFLLSLVVVGRTFLSDTSFLETIVILTSIFLIVFISINLGAGIPLVLQKCGIDPAHASTTIQVIMDIFGVLVTCRVAQYLMGE